MSTELTSPEKVIFKSTYEFCIKYMKLSHDAAEKEAMDKIIKKRKLANKLTFKH